jgi:hypothetical protein
MKTFELEISVQRENNVDTVVSVSGNFTQEDVKEAFNVAEAAIVAEAEEGVVFSGHLNFQDGDDAESILIPRVKKSTIMEVVAMMNANQQTEQTEQVAE